MRCLEHRLFRFGVRNAENILYAKISMLCEFGTHAHTFTLSELFLLRIFVSSSASVDFGSFRLV